MRTMQIINPITGIELDTVKPSSRGSNPFIKISSL